MVVPTEMISAGVPETAGREVRLVTRPATDVEAHHFQLVRVPVPRVRPGQLLVRNTWMSVDPYMREAMKPVSHLPAVNPGDVPYGGALGYVVESRASGIAVGATVTHFSGWRDYAVVDAADAKVVDTESAPAAFYLGALGDTGLTAYATLTEVAPIREGDVVFISAAAGAVGSIAGQIARKLGAAAVIGSAGGPAKVRRVVEHFGFDAGIDYRSESLSRRLAELAPEGIDYYFDNVGGDHLEAAIDALRDRGRIAMVGAVSGYNAPQPPPGPRNLFALGGKNAALYGMHVVAYEHLRTEWVRRAANWLAEGSLHTDQTVVEGLEQAPAALHGVLHGANTGKMLVRIN